MVLGDPKLNELAMDLAIRGARKYLRTNTSRKNPKKRKYLRGSQGAYNDYLVRTTRNMNAHKRITTNAVSIYNNISSLKNRSSTKTSVCEVTDSVPDLSKLFVHTRKLYGFEITDIKRYDPTAAPTSSASHVSNTRLVDQVWVNGFHLQMEVCTVSTLPVWFNYALVQSKNGRPSVTAPADASQPYRVDNIGLDGFLRSNKISRDENLDATLTSMEINHSSISTDQWTVLKRDKILLGPCRSTTDNQIFAYQGMPSGHRFIDTYYPIKKLFAYNDDSDEKCETPVFFVYWCDSVFNNADVISDHRADIQFMPVTHFDDKNRA